MRKIGLSFIWILFGVIVSAQTAQEQFEQLLPKYEQLEKEYTTEFAVFSERRIALSLRTSDANYKQLQLLSQKSIVDKMCLVFKEMEVPSEKIPNNAALKNLPSEDFEALTERWQSLIRKELFVQPPVIDSAVLKNLSETAKSTYWKNKTNELEAAIAAFPEKRKQLQIATNELNALEKDANEAIRRVDERLTVVKQVAKSCDELTEACRVDYRKNGPNGFNQAYARNFPEIAREHENRIQREKMPQTKEPEIHIVVDEPADFPGGYPALKKYIEENLVYPERAKKKGIEGKCYMQFIISTQGKISNVRVMKGVSDCPECDEAAIKLVKGMPDWIPGKVGGKPVNSTYNLPIKFMLPVTEEKK